MTSAARTRPRRSARWCTDDSSACHFSELLLADSPELEVTQTADDVEARLEFGPEAEPGTEIDETIGFEPGGGGTK